jgi:non-ribosomal peptide synthetase component F/methionyl-tRNA formyltransferase/acyl carrier protein
MNTDEKFRCFMIGSESHLIQCAEILVQHGHQICGIISSVTSITNWAEEKGIPHVEPGPDLGSVLSQQSFDYFFSITYLSIIPNEILALPRKCAINFHDGPLPRYAGLNATSWALINQEKTHGVTWHIMTAEADKGVILKQRYVDIVDGDTAFTVNAKCYEACIDSFAELVGELAIGRVELHKQNLAERTYFSKYKRPPAACTLSWNQPADKIVTLVRALDFGPYSNSLGLPKLVIQNEVFIVPEIDVLDETSQIAPGTIVAIEDDYLKVATASNFVGLGKLLTMQGQQLTIPDFVAKFGVRKGDRLAELDQETAHQLTTINSAICRHEAFWIERLARREPIEVPYANRSLALTSQGQYATVPMSIPPEVNTFLTKHDELANRSEFVGAAFAVYLTRISNNYAFDLGFSHPYLQQIATRFEQYFATHVPFRVELDPSASFGEAMAALKELFAVVKQRKTYARDAVLRYPELGTLRVNDDNSQFSVVVEQVECLEDYKPLPGSELTLVLQENGTECHWVHNTAILDKESIFRMQRQFAAFLQNVVAETNRSIAEISVLTHAEHHQLMTEWNKTKVDYPRHLCIHQLFEAQAELTPDAVAVVFEEQQITYQQLNSLANQLAHHLRKLSVAPETLVGIYMERSLQTIVGLLGILKAGGAYLPLDQSYPAERIAFILDDAQVPVLLTQAHLAGDLPVHQAQVVCVDTELCTISNESKENVDSGITPDNLSYVIYTSGSTGKPKGVMVCHSNVVNFFTGMDGCIPHDAPGVCLAVTSLSFDISVLELLWTLARGFKVILYADKTRDQALIGQLSAGTNKEIEPSELANTNKGVEDYSIPAQINRHNVTHFQCTPSMASMLLMDDETRVALRNIGTFLVGGEPLPLALAMHLKQILSGNVVNMYGPTETTIWSSTYTVDGEESTIPIGRPIANTEIYILDSNLQPVPVGVEGELFIGGDGVARGYLKRPDLTADRFIKHPFNDNPGARLYRTGDLARYRSDGNIEFLSRIDHQVKIRGHRIELGEIETVLEQHPAVREAVVVAREDTPNDKRLVAYLIPNQNDKVSSSELRDYMKLTLPEFMIPSRIVKLKAFPLTPNRKIDRKALPAPGQVPIESEIAYVQPKNELERTIADIWQGLLNVPKVGINDNFFDLGGHSILVVQTIHRLREVINSELSVVDIFRFPTIQALSDYLSQGSGNGGQTTVQRSADRARSRREAIMRRRQGRQRRR